MEYTALYSQYRHCRVSNNERLAWVGLYQAYIKSTFSEYGRVAYIIKGNKAYNNMLANSLLLHLSLVPEVGPKG